MSLSQRTKLAIGWNSLDLIVRQGVNFGFTIALARLLSPDEFGTFAILYLFSGIASCFVDSGFSAALVQAKSLSQIDISTVFWFNLIMAGVMATCLWIAAPLLGSYFEKPVLIGLTYGMSVNILINSSASVQSALLTRTMNFKYLMISSSVGVIVGGGLGTILAINAFGVWSILWQTLATSAGTTSALWILSPWRPSMNFNPASLKRFFRFGGFVFASGILDTIYTRIYSVLLGKHFGTVDLGLYSRADQTQQLPASVLTSVISRVAFPAFSQINADVNELRQAFVVATNWVMLSTAPVLFGLAAVSVDEPLLSNLGKHIGTCLQHTAMLDADVIVHNGKPYLIELNPRFGGHYPFSHIAGANIPAAIIALAQGLEPQKDWLEFSAGITAQKEFTLTILESA